MGASLPPTPKLGKSTALNMVQTVVNRLANIVPTLTTILSPVEVYQPGPTGGTVGNELIAQGSATNFSLTYGTWVAPDLNGNGTSYTVQVECFGGGGGGGGGNVTQGGGGGGGGEYACETQYPIVPGHAYTYVVGLPGTGGTNNSTQVNPGAAGSNGGITIFDIAGYGLAGGVTANGGAGGDQTAVGIGGSGGSGSTNSIHFNGGNGATNNSSNGSDNPISLSETTGMFVGNSLSSSIIPAWYILNDAAVNTSKINDNSEDLNTASVTTISGGLAADGTTAPTQVPAYTQAAFPPVFWNAQAAGAAMQWKIGSLTSGSARVTTPTFGFAGSKLTVSCWIQCDPSGTWGNPANNSIGVIATNSAVYTTNSLKGYALYLIQTGTPTNPAWALKAAVGDGTHSRTVLSYNIGQTPSTWYYVVMTYNAGTLTLYVNGASIGTASSVGYTSVPGGVYGSTMGMNPSTTVDWFFGYMSNVWFANDCATSTLVTQAFGLSPATGGAGGGASGGPSANGGAGVAASGATGGAGGTPATQPASLTSTTTAAQGGWAGANAGHGDNPSLPSGGSYGGGGGAGGNMTSPPALTVLTVPFTSAATYYGTDAASNAGSQYNTNQEAHPASALNTVLYAGGLPSDTPSGSKNSLLLLPPGLKSKLTGYTINNVFLTVTNAFPSNNTESILEVGFSNDTTLPQTYTGADLTAYIGAVPIAVGSGTITYELTEAGGVSTNVITVLQNGTATAFVLGPGATPTFDAFNAQTGPQFYASVYGPGAYDQFGNAQYPYLTIVMEKTATTQEGSVGSGGGIVITAINNAETPVAFVQPFAGNDGGGNQYAQGFTGPVTAWDPTSLTAGSYKPETWKKITSYSNSWAASANGYAGFWVRMHPDGFVECAFDVTNPASTATGSTIIAAGVINSAYYPNGGNGNVNVGPVCAYGTIPSGNSGPYIEVSNTGAVIYRNTGASAAAGINLAGYIRWWPGTI